MSDFPVISQTEARRSQVAGALLLDVRSAQEFARGHLAGSLSVPLERLSGQITGLAPSLDQPLLLYCTNGRRSRTAAQILRRLGYSRLYIVIP